MITKISYWVAIIFNIPNIIMSFFYNFIAIMLLKYSYKKYGLFVGYHSKIALKLNKRAYRIINEVSVDTLCYATQIKEKEEIMKAIRSDKAYDFIVKDDRKKNPKDRTTFKIKFLDPYTAAKLGDQIFDVKGMGANRKERLLTGTQQFEILKNCLVGWDNMEHPDSNGSEPRFLEFDTKNIEEMISMIPPNYRSELADFARGESELEEGEGAS